MSEDKRKSSLDDAILQMRELAEENRRDFLAEVEKGIHRLYVDPVFKARVEAIVGAWTIVGAERGIPTLMNESKQREARMSALIAVIMNDRMDRQLKQQSERRA